MKEHPIRITINFWFLVHETYDSLMQFEGGTNIYIYL